MAIILVNGEFVTTLSEAVGFKTGIALSKNQIIDIFPNDSSYKKILSMDDDCKIRIYSTDIDDIFMQLLYHLGNVDSPIPIPSSVRLLHKYKDDERLASIHEAIFEIYCTHFKRMIDEAVRSGNKTMNPEPFMKECTQKYGRDGLNMSYELIVGNSEDLHCRLSSYRRFDWSNEVKLEDLFKSESLESKYGDFIDQRYIDYLHRNTDKLGEMNWRKFEGLTAEYFTREGYKVELGSGRNDGGIDLRLWKDNAGEGEAPLILVQCKRHKQKIERQIVKALWADVQWEKADSGLIVTTSTLSKGSKEDCVARGYNIHQADKDIIRKWLENMRTPGSGVFMGK